MYILYLYIRTLYRCSYFGFCQYAAALAPAGPYARWRRWRTPPSGYAIDVWAAMAARLRSLRNTVPIKYYYYNYY